MVLGCIWPGKVVGLLPVKSVSMKRLTTFLALGFLAFNAFSIASAQTDCVTPPSGIVGWWKGDGNGNDSVGTNNATVPDGVTYDPAEVGLGFSLNGNTNR